MPFGDEQHFQLNKKIIWGTKGKMWGAEKLAVTFYRSCFIMKKHSFWSPIFCVWVLVWGKLPYLAKNRYVTNKFGTGNTSSVLLFESHPIEGWLVGADGFWDQSITKPTGTRFSGCLKGRSINWYFGKYGIVKNEWKVFPYLSFCPLHLLSTENLEQLWKPV